MKEKDTLNLVKKLQKAAMAIVTGIGVLFILYSDTAVGELICFVVLIIIASIGNFLTKKIKLKTDLENHEKDREPVAFDPTNGPEIM